VFLLLLLSENISERFKNAREYERLKMRKTVYEQTGEGTGLALQLSMYNAETGKYEVASQNVGRTFEKPWVRIDMGEEPSQENLFKKYRIGFD